MNICIFGDSIAWGEADYEKGGWVEKLKTKLMPKGINVYNLGISSDTTEGVLKRIESEAEKRNPDIIIFAVGINDCSKIKNENVTDLNKFRKNIELIFDKAKLFTDKIVFIGLTDIDETKTNPYSWDKNISSDNQSIGEYDGTIRSFCEKNNIPFINMLGVLINDGDLSDGLHPSSRGHQKIFEIIEKTIEPLWKE
ncbi:MAG: GDSL-type esterase/lipase family protein [Candidatus Paceibacterota bacterium]